MFKFIFQGKLYTADSLEQLDVLLKQAGFDDDIFKLYFEANVEEEVSAEDVLEQESKLIKTVLNNEEQNIKAALTEEDDLLNDSGFINKTDSSKLN